MDPLSVRLQALSSAEDFLRFFGLPYDERVLQVSRLHILKRFHRYLHAQPQLPQQDEVALFRRYRELLERAYLDFVASTPAQEKVFRVFEQAAGLHTVPVTALRASRRRSTPA